MNCPNCKTEIGDDKIFCPYCGNKIVKPEAEQPPEIPFENPPSVPASLVIDVEPAREKKNHTSGLFIALSIFFGVVCILLLSIVISNNKKAARSQTELDQSISQNQDLSAQVDQFETNISDLNSQISQKNSQISDLENQVNQLQESVSDYRSKIDDAIQNNILVRATSIYNSNYDGDKISDSLYSSSLLYLSIDYEIVVVGDISNFNGNDLDIKIYKPDGTLMQGDSSPYDCTYTNTIDGRYGYFGWGNKDGDAYSDGLYVVQFIYQGVVVGTEAVIIN